MTDATARFVFDPDTRRIGLRVGKVELGQHIHEAYELWVAEALGVAVGAVRVMPVNTDGPDDGLTVGSLSIQVTGTALAEAACALAARLRDGAARRLNAASGDLVLDPVALRFSHGSRECDLFEVVALWDPALLGPVPEIAPRQRLVAEAVTGQRLYLQDMVLPGMLQTRALRGRAPGDVAHLLPDDCRIVTDQGFAAVIAEDEASLLALWSRLPELPPEGDSRCDGPVADWIKAQCCLTTRTGAEGEGDIAPPLFIVASRPFVMHGSIAPSCALAQWIGGVLTVWTQSQGIFPLRAQIARVLGLEPSNVVLHHVPSAGTYGHSAADDAAMDAAFVALQTEGRPVRVAWPREDEFRHGLVGAPMLVEARLAMDADNRITAWHQEIWSGPHGQRPGGGGDVNLLAAMERHPALRPRDITELPAQLGAGAGRNAMPLYAIPDMRVTTHVVQDLPVRTSSLRGLGAQINTVAIEAAMDKLAARTGESPFAVRARHLDDTRARVVLSRLEALCGGAIASTRAAPDEAIGIGLGRYKNKAAYAAVAAHIRLEDAPRLLRLWAVVDAGRVISRDGTLNQIEGGMIQAASWTLCEGVLLRGGRIDADGWGDYPTLCWDALPDLQVELVEPSADAPPLGVGECMVGPTSAAIVNAISAALGETLADLPLNRDRLIEALSR